MAPHGGLVAAAARKRRQTIFQPTLHKPFNQLLQKKRAGWPLAEKKYSDKSLKSFGVFSRIKDPDQVSNAILQKVPEMPSYSSQSSSSSSSEQFSSKSLSGSYS